MHTDASGNLGYGAVFHQNLFYGQWNEEWLTYDIMLKEPYPIDVWGHRMSNWSILFNCDNEALVYVLNKQSYLEPNVMILIRKLVLLTLQYNILFKVCHLPKQKVILFRNMT